MVGRPPRPSFTSVLGEMGLGDEPPYFLGSEWAAKFKSCFELPFVLDTSGKRNTFADGLLVMRFGSSVFGVYEYAEAGRRKGSGSRFVVRVGRSCRLLLRVIGGGESLVSLWWPCLSLSGRSGSLGLSFSCGFLDKPASSSHTGECVSDRGISTNRRSPLSSFSDVTSCFEASDAEISELYSIGSWSMTPLDGGS